VSGRQLCQIYNDAALSSKLIEEYFATLQFRTICVSFRLGGQKSQHKSYSCILLVCMYSSVCHTGETMCCVLQLFERNPSREIIGPKIWTEKISYLWRVKNTEYFNDDLKILSTNYL
jgi:hypothetical protein